MLNTLIGNLALIVTILLLVMISKKIKIAYPVVLVIGGLLLSQVPGFPQVSIDPEVVFLLFLPPLLFEAAWYTSWKDFWKWRRVISSFAFLIVVLTALVVAVASNMLIPGFSLALGFLLGGIVSPPDAVSAVSILKNVKVPRRLLAILEGESLLNDASSLIVFRFALVAVSTGQFIFHHAALNFAFVVIFGVIIGLFVGMVYLLIHRWLPTDVNIGTILNITAPYVMYIVAEKLHVSGVLSVVSGALFLSIRSTQFLDNSGRLHGSNIWSALSFMLNGLVFMLIGLELPVIIKELGSQNLYHAAIYGILITVILIATRIFSTLGASLFTMFISKYIKTADSNPGWRLPLVFGWAGMRGVVSLAAALSIPISMENGQAFPQRNMILFITFTVILLTLIIQGLTLPALIRWLHLAESDPSMPIVEQEELLKTAFRSRTINYLNQLKENHPEHNSLVNYLGEKVHIDYFDPGRENESKAYYNISLTLINQLRESLEHFHSDERIDDHVVRKFQNILDLEEEKLNLRYGIKF